MCMVYIVGRSFPVNKGKKGGRETGRKKESDGIRHPVYYRRRKGQRQRKHPTLGDSWRCPDTQKAEHNNV